MISTRSVFFVAVLAAGSLAAESASANVSLDWAFTDRAGNAGNGHLTVSGKDQVTGFSGKFDGQTVKFYKNPYFLKPNPTQSTGVPSEAGKRHASGRAEHRRGQLHL